MMISSRPDCLEKGDVVCLQCLFDTCNPSFSWSPSRFEACHPGAVCLEGQLVGCHACQMSKPLDCSDHFPGVLVSYHVSSC